VTVEIRLLGESDAAVLDNVAVDVFDFELDPEMTKRFLASATHHIAVAIEDGAVVGMATANEYLHPDKPVQIWVNEMGVAPSHRRRGIGKQLLRRILDFARDRGFEEIWLGTEDDNAAARALYEAMGGNQESFVMYSWKLDREGRRE
jgi:ribosomal protein S18 acetylase RimI-like enzyme